MADENQTPEDEQQEETTEAVSEEPVAEETPAEETPAEEPAAEEAEAPAEEPAAGEPAAEADAEEPAAEAEGEEPAAEGEEPAEETAPAPQQKVVKPKRKRLPRSQRHKHSKPKRERPAEPARRPIVRLPKPDHVRGRRQERRGVVVSSAMDKTIVVKVDMVKAHPKYKKVVRRSSKFHAHDEQNAAKVGDLVRIVETRPLSKTKNWRLAEVLEEAK
jgi:small subunit ribosomal protein S17